jgi:hypothetical protein
MVAQTARGTNLIHAHEPAIAHDVGGNDRRKLAFDALRHALLGSLGKRFKYSNTNADPVPTVSVSLDHLGKATGDAGYSGISSEE